MSDLARQALTHSASDETTDGETFHGFRPFPRRGVIVTNELINQIRDEEGI